MATVSSAAVATRVTDFRTRHPADGAAIAIAIGGVWFGLLAGFIPDMLVNLQKGHGYHPLVHVHAASAVAWMALLTWQATLVRRGELAAHRRNGRRIGVWLALLVSASALTALWFSSRIEVAAGTLELPKLAWRGTNIMAFTVLTAAGFLRIDRPDIHKRLILFGAFAVVDVGFARWVGGDLRAVLGLGIPAQMAARYGLTWLLAGGMAWHDITTRGRVHPAWIAGASVLAVQELTSAWLYSSAWWPALGRALLGL